MTSKPTHTAPELLVPAGDWEAMRAAVANGADAVYFGLDVGFNARHLAKNFQPSELPEIMHYLHAHNVKGFLTFNTLIFSDELEAAAKHVQEIAAAGVDAVIVRDLGLVRLMKAIAPSLPVHGSTQMTLTEPRGIEFIRSLGVERVVLARELSVEDIKKIATATDMELEVFIHGALCVAYSGQCLTSESIGGRSANRGQCAQACRLPYELIVDGEKRELGDKAYLLSPQDLAAYDLVGDLAACGVASLKIEGRLKSAHYVAATTQTYRAAVDAARKAIPSASSRFTLSDEQRGDLEQTFSRGFSPGFLAGVNHQRLVTARFPKSRGRRIGEVVELTPRSVIVELSMKQQGPRGATPLVPGDGIVFDEGHPEQDEQGGRVFAVRPRGKHAIEVEFNRGDINLHAVSVGAIVWKTDDPALRKRLEHSFSRDVVVKREPLHASLIAHVGGPLRLTLRTDNGSSSYVESDDALQPASKFPVTEGLVREQLARLGDTPFELATLELNTQGGPMVPKSVLNELRRRAVDELLQKRERLHAIANEDALNTLRSDGYQPVKRSVSVQDHPLEATNENAAVSTYLLTRTLAQLDAALAMDASLRPAMVYCDFEDVRKYRDAVARARSANMPIALATLRVVKPSEEGWLKQVLDCQPDAVLVRNLAGVGFYTQHSPELPLIGDYSLNVSNELTARIFAEHNLVRMVPSYDLSWRQLAAMFGRFDVSRFETVIHQHMPMFHMEHCVFAHVLSTGKDYRDCGRPCEKHEVDLRDRAGQPHPLIPDAGCRNTVFNAEAQSAAEYVPKMKTLGIRHFRIELLRERADEVEPLIRRYTDLLNARTQPREALRSLRVLNQLGVTRGTFDRE